MNAVVGNASPEAIASALDIGAKKGVKLSDGLASAMLARCCEYVSSHNMIAEAEDSSRRAILQLIFRATNALGMRASLSDLTNSISACVKGGGDSESLRRLLRTLRGVQKRLGSPALVALVDIASESAVVADAIIMVS